MTSPPDSRGYPQRNTSLAIAPRDALALDMAGATVVSEQPEEGLHLRDLLRIFLKHKWTILAIFVSSALFSVVMTYLASPVYRASTTIQIERFAPRVLDFKEVSPGESGDYWSDGSDFYFTNYELLKSRALAERAVEDIGLRGNLGGMGDAVAEHAAESGAQGAAHSNALQDIFAWLRRGPKPVAVDPASRKDTAVVSAFQNSITVEPVRKSRLVRLHFDSTDPFFAAKAANTIAQSFININLERRFEASSYAKTFLEEKLVQTKAKLEDAERELVAFTRESQVVNIDDKQNIISQNLQEYNTAVAKAEQERIRAEVLYRQAQENPDSLAQVQDNRSVVALKAAKAKLEAEYQENLKVYKPAFPKMLQIKGQMDEVDRQIAAEIAEIRRTLNSSYRSALAQETALKAKLVGAQQDMLTMQGSNFRYSILKREVDTNRQLYEGLLQRLKEVGLAGGVGINNISVIDKAQVPLAPFKPVLKKNLSMGLAIGLILGLLVAWLLEYFDDSIRYSDDVERETGAAVLGVVPKLKALDVGKLMEMAAASPEDPLASLGEAYRSIRTALQFSTSSGAPRRFVVTSSSKGEGKSTTALALAMNFAQMGKPVLLIDADLRNPVLHKHFGVDNLRGLSNHLSSKMGLMEAIHGTPVPNLFIMTTGPLPPNPVELLSSMKLLEMLSQYEEHFAHVIVDGPPVLGLADAIVLCNQVDNSVFVIESGKTRKAHAKAALKRLAQAGVYPLGVVLTKVDTFHDPYGQQSYYYRYGSSSGSHKPVAAA